MVGTVLDRVVDRVGTRARARFRSRAAVSPPAYPSDGAVHTPVMGCASARAICSIQVVNADAGKGCAPIPY